MKYKMHNQIIMYYSYTVVFTMHCKADQRIPEDHKSGSV